MKSQNPFSDAPVISVYTRKQAIEDSVLIDISMSARQVGFKLPMAITANLAAEVEDANELAELLTASIIHASRAPNKDLVEFNFKDFKTWLVISPGDNGEPVLTVMKPEDY